MINNLNEQQCKAVTYPLKPVLIMAGAGTGKTTILTNRIWYLINELGLHPDEILAITFTNKAAEEMNLRIKAQVGYPLEWIGTFHSICIRILRQEIHHLNRSNNFKIVDDEDSQNIIKGIYEELNFDKTKYSFKNMLHTIDVIKNNQYDLDDLNDFKIQWKLKIDNQDILHMVKVVYQKYVQKFLDYNYLDFNDILNFTNLIFEQHPEVTNYWSNKFKYLLVDEFQDTNIAQYELIEHLGGEKFNVFAVGDEDQIIYTFRGADSAVIDKFIHHFPNNDVEVLKLEENYRSTNQILGVANSLIDKNIGRIKKNLFSQKPDHIKPIVHSSNTAEEEANYVASKINRLILEGVRPSEIAILYRNNHLSRTYEQSLIFHDIRYNLYGGYKFYQRSEIKDILAYLQVINNFDEISLLRIINIPRRKISDATVRVILNYANQQHCSTWDALLKHDEINELNNSQKNAIKGFIDLIEDFRSKNLNDIENFFQYLIANINYFDYVKSINATKVETVEKNLEELKNSISSFKNRRGNNWSLTEYLHEIALFTNADDRKKHENAVSLMTIHAAKGLEFEYVFLVSFNDGTFPSKHSVVEVNGLIEERRLAYVAITRAKKELYLCWNSGYNYTDRSSSLPSRFLKDIKPELLNKSEPKFSVKSNWDLQWFDSQQSKNIEKEEVYNDAQLNDYKVGDQIVHTVFGTGIVMDVKNDILEISFKPPYNTKHLIFNHKSIKRKISHE